MKKICLMRDVTTPQGAISRNTVSTDAINAVNRWQSINSSRVLGVVVESECFSIEVDWDSRDNTARDQLNYFFLEYGLKTIDCLKEN